MVGENGAEPQRVVVAGDWHGNPGWASRVIEAAAKLLQDEEHPLVLQLGDYRKTFDVSNDPGAPARGAETARRLNKMSPGLPPSADTAEYKVLEGTEFDELVVGNLTSSWSASGYTLSR